MIINFDEIKVSDLENFKGGDKVYSASIYDDGDAKIMKGKLIPGASIGYHKHEGNAEIIYILDGVGNVRYDDDELVVKPGCAHYCPEGHSHSLRNDGKTDLIFFAVVK